jgi:hypothetical protein
LLVPFGQSALHAPLPHTSVDEHARVHAPQCAGSVETSTHAPWHATNGAGHGAPASPSDPDLVLSLSVPHAPINSTALMAPSQTRAAQTKDGAVTHRSR